MASSSVNPLPLAQPLYFEFAQRSAPNRFLKAALTERMCTWHPTYLPARGIPTKEIINLYRRWGEGGFGVILTGNILTDYEHLEALGNPIIPRDAPFSGERFEAFRDLATAAKQHGALIIAQVNHPGRQVDAWIQPHPISASAIQLQKAMGMTFGKPRAATRDDIASFIDGWAHAAEYLYRAGYDGIQLHAAHGYLLAQFISQTTNKRSDEYGGSIRNRARLILEIAAEIRRRVPCETGFVVGIKLNSVEFQEDGLNPEECRELCAMLENEGRFDFVELSGGTYQNWITKHVKESTRRRESFFLEFAELIVPALKKTKCYVTGGFRSVEGMVNALETVDGVGLGRTITEQVTLCKDILEGRTSRARDQAVDMNDFGLTAVISGAQMPQIGKDEMPVDMSRPENVSAFMEDMRSWRKEMLEDRDRREKFGGVVVTSVPAVPYMGGLAPKL